MKLRFEKFTDPNQEKTIRADYARLVKMVDKTIGAGVTPLHSKMQAKWFGAVERTKLDLYLQKMHDVINSPARTITFVNRTGGVLKVEYKSLLNPVLLPEGHPGKPLEIYDPMSGQPIGGANAYVFPVNRFTEKSPIDQIDTMAHVGSGMRIYLTSFYFLGGDEERSATIYHELAHKVLACEDYCYGAANCKALKATPDRAVRNADNYAQFLMDL